jgi:hypothetical protein
VVPEEGLACAWEVEDDVYGLIMWWLSIDRYSFWVEVSFHRPVRLKKSSIDGNQYLDYL